MKTAIIRLHSGLGDHFICYALVRHYAEWFTKVYLPVKEPNCISVRHLYESEKKVEVVPCTCDDDIEKTVSLYRQAFDSEYFGFGLHGKNWAHYIGKTPEFDDAFYYQQGCLGDLRFFMPIPNWSGDKPIAYPSTPFAFVADDCSEGTKSLSLTTEFPIVKPVRGQTRNIFDYMHMISHAAEIHCVPSAFYHLIDLMPRQKQRLFLYQSARPTPSRAQHDWTVL